MMAQREASACARTPSLSLTNIALARRRWMIPQCHTALRRQLGCENTQIVVEPDVVNLLPELTWHMDEPTADPAIIAAYLVCREARKKATVLLSGVGGDELFAGYRKHIAHYWAEAYRRLPAVRDRLDRIWRSESARACEDSRMKGAVRLAKKMARSASLSLARSIHHELHVSRRRAEDSALSCRDCSDGSSSIRRLAPCITFERVAMRTSSTRCSISIPRFS